MSVLIAIAYEDEVVARRAATAIEHGPGGAIEPDAIAVIERDGDGTYRVHTSHHAVSSQTAWGLVWSTLFGFLFFVPVCGVSVGAGLRSSMARVSALDIDPGFVDEVRYLLQPGTSALFAAVREAGARDLADRVGWLGGTTLRSPISATGEADLQSDLHGGPIGLHEGLTQPD